MAKHIGIIGCTAEGAALCYSIICREAIAKMGEHNHPVITLHNFPLSEWQDGPADNRPGWIGGIVLKTMEILKNAGADFVILPANTPHISYETVKPKASLPWLHIAEAVADEAEAKGFKKLGIMGTRLLTESSVYPKILEMRGIQYEKPMEKDLQQIDRLIFDELVNGIFLPETRHFLNEAAQRLKEQGCDAVVLGCTEIPLIVNPDEFPVPTLDSTEILAKAALSFALTSSSN